LHFLNKMDDNPDIYPEGDNIYPEGYQRDICVYRIKGEKEPKWYPEEQALKGRLGFNKYKRFCHLIKNDIDIFLEILAMISGLLGGETDAITIFNRCNPETSFEERNPNYDYEDKKFK